MERKIGDKMKNIIEIKNLCRQFDKFVAVNNISFTVKQGEDDGCSPLDRLVLEQLQHPLGVRSVQVSSLVPSQGEQLRPFRRIAGDALPLDGPFQDGGNGALV